MMDHSGKTWDLNDRATYEESWFPKKCLDLGADGLYKEVTKKVGNSLFYMDCWSPALLGVSADKRGDPAPCERMYDDQRERVVELGRRFIRSTRLNPELENDVPWLRKQLFLILDETENQC